MEFSCQRDELVQGITTVERAVATRGDEPLLAGIMIEAVEDKLRLVATDREIGVQCYVPATIREPGCVVLEGRVFSQVVRKLAGDEVTFYPNKEGMATVQGGKARFSLHTLLPDEYPTLPLIKTQQRWQISQAELRRMIRQISFAAATDDARPYLTGVYLEVSGKDVFMVATDIYRLAFRKGSLLESAEANISAIVPARTMQELMRALESDEETAAEFVIADNQVEFHVGDVTIVSRLIEGQFPDYRRALPKEEQRGVNVDRREFLGAVERAALIAARRGMSLVRLEAEDTTLSVKAKEAEIGQVQEEISLSSPVEPAGASFQTYYIIDVLRALDSEKVNVAIGDGVKQGSIRPLGDSNYTYVIMPVRVG